MAKVLKLDRYINVDTEYETGERVAYIIRKYGTDSSSDAILYIEGKPTGTIDSDVAPLYVTSSNLLGPLDLGDLYYVIPPETKFKFTGASGSKMRLIGDIIQLDPGEKLGSPYTDRYERQFDHYITKYDGTLTLATDEAFGADEEKTVLEITPKSNEVVKINNYAGVSGSGGTIDEGYFAVVMYYNNKPLEYLKTSNFGPGIDILSMPLPPADTTNEIPWTFKDNPKEVPGPNEFVFKIRNISGTDLSPTSGSAWSFTLKLITEYIRK